MNCLHNDGFVQRGHVSHARERQPVDRLMRGGPSDLSASVFVVFIRKNMAKRSVSPAAASDPQYEDRIVLFLDFLGFKELVDRTTREPGFLKRLIRAMDVISEIGSDDAELFKSQRLTQFSDSVVISYLVTERSAVFWLLYDIAIHVVRLAELGFLVRGGMTVGPVYHSSRHVVGPAMNEAYRLESQIAKYPRVVIDPKVLQIARRARNENHSAHEEEGYARAFMTEDADGQFFFDYVSWDSVVHVVGGDNDLYGDYLGALGTLIRDGLRHDQPGVQEKYLWLQQRYAAAIQQIIDLPSDHAYRAENPVLCEQISRLPMFKMDTKLARKAVKKLKASSQVSAKPKKEKKVHG
ncbi:hypothetical protein [Burkholderia pseudomallei]|uniref:hypothetical protein n=1 Tax=Burkholderia pseudomallei TaxID=28450 RepID=UPI0011C210D0|nr:hypothetical protein [Burkholderia pseudomallei]